MADAMDQKVKELRSTRADYAEECKWHKFLIDSAYGAGGFVGKFGATAVSHLGWAAEAYAKVSAQALSGQSLVVANRGSYLDQFPREDDKKFDRRIDVAHYTNYVGPLHELLLSYVNKAAMVRTGVPAAVEEWMLNVDGKGTPWDVLQAEVIRPRASLLGWCPVLFDMAAPEDGEVIEISQARAREVGRRVRAIPLYPLNILDWIEDDDGDLEAVKICTHRMVRADLRSPAALQEEYALWYGDRVERFTVTDDGKKPAYVSAESVQFHDFKCVPIVIARTKATPDDKVRGLSSIAGSAVASRRLFNLESELDDHIRGQVFAVMGIPVEDVSLNIGEIVAGNGAAIKVPMAASMGLHFVAPPATVAATLETRMSTMVQEIYRTENIEHTKSTGIAPSSGIARAYEFEQTNRRLAGISGNLARSEQESLRLVGSQLSAPTAEDATVTAPADFAVEDLSAEIATVLSAVGLNLGPTAALEMKKRLVRRLLPNLPPDVQEDIEQEIGEEVAQGVKDAKALAEVTQAGADGIMNTPEVPQ